MSIRLDVPVSLFARPVRTLQPEDSWERAATLMRDALDGAVPVTDGETLVGLVTAKALGNALADGVDLTGPTVASPAVTIRAYQSAADALRLMETENVDRLWVVDDANALLGAMSYADLYPRPLPRPVLPLVGGMATLFGVYLTTGTASGGPNKWALVATGFSMFALLATGNYLGAWITEDWLVKVIPTWMQNPAAEFLALALFLAGLRLSPLAGIHGAEHQVVHTLERGETLSIDVVKRMPRVHPRCGTNLAAGMMLFLSIFRTPWVPSSEVRLLAAVLATLLLWKTVGSFMQKFITTRPPSDAQVARAINSANDLLKNYSLVRRLQAPPIVRLWNMGILQVISGSLLGAGILTGIAYIFKIDVRL